MIVHFDLIICICLRSFDEFTSSFDNIDWCEVWNHYCQEKGLKMSILPYQDVEQLRATLLKTSLVSLEHSFLVVPGPETKSRYLEDRELFSGHSLQINIDYLGFILDEYNMLWNSIKSLMNIPRIFNSPSTKVGGNYIVCGSGPSLDDSLDYLKNLPDSWTIVACASNYRTLRSAGIDVDILCLLERGDNEYAQYLSIQNEFGLGDTYLFASVV